MVPCTFDGVSQINSLDDEGVTNSPPEDTMQWIEVVDVDLFVILVDS